MVHDRAAPGAKLAFADLGDKLGWIYLPPYEELLATGHPYAQIHSMSWGVDINLYTTETKIFDGKNYLLPLELSFSIFLTNNIVCLDFMYENDEFLIVVAAGNIGEGNAYNTVGEPGKFDELELTPLIESKLIFIVHIFTQLRERTLLLLGAITTVEIVALRIQKESGMHLVFLGEYTHVETRRCSTCFIILFILRHLIKPRSDI